MKKLLVVCMGNICRSPTGEAILRAKSEQLGISVEVDSAGTIGYHQGNPPDSRAKAAGERRGYSFKGIRSRKVVSSDFDNFDLILAADRDNFADLIARCPQRVQYKIKLFLEFSDTEYDEIPDPYYGGDSGFELVLDLIEEASENVLKSL
ncbi:MULTISPECIES: low molecular weight protein-tyrosine-phosphatase [Vibrio]|uniref:protein-tyrosine-phosphatase n=1 Tax=Vibrio bivalvicida TaxID=1276888 RepID=A0A177XZI9_9VIBR|nr:MULTISPECIES: low molecular weight protein-tyrosine-phosphatase [Vibrio]KLN66165.1 protein tyrosine phosphatase [Vibrio sp. VPAP30]OAJ94022.1 protein-tyrosine-phosphatase [Vibrio bivalvicida]